MDKEQLLKDVIVAKYDNLKKFSDETGVPYMTIRNIINRGIDRASVVTMLRITRILGIDLDALIEGRMEPRRNPIDLDSLTDLDLELLELIRQLPEDQKTLLRSLLQGIAPPPS